MSLSDEELQFRRRARRRLVGAIVLTVVAALVLPLVLDREPRSDGQDIQVRIPEPDSKGFTSRLVPVEPKPAPAPEKPADPPAEKSPEKAAEKPAEKPAEKAEKPAPAPKAAAPEKRPAEKPAAKPAADKPKAAEPATADKEVFVVQLGAYASEPSARQLAAKLSAAGMRAYTERLKTAEGDRIRVRAGPFPSREAAEKAQDRIKALALAGVGNPKVVRETD